MTSTPTGPTRERISAGFVLLLGALTAIGPFTIDLYLAAFPRIADEFGTTPAAVQLTITATLAGLAIGQLLIGSLSDALGRRRPLIGGLVLYVLASAAIIVAPSVQVLAAMRFVQGLAAAAGMVLSMAIVRDRFSGIQVGKVLARLMLVVGVAPIVAPVIGSFMLGLGSWRWQFGVLTAFGVVLLGLAVFVLPESLPVDRRRSGGVRPALRTYGSLLRDRTFMLLTLVSGFFMAAIFTYVSSATFVFQDQFGLSVGGFALVFTAGAAALTAGTQINGALIGRFTSAQILRVAVLAGAVVATAMLVTALLGLGMWPLIVTLVLTLFTAGFVLPSVPTIALDANPDRAGSASALLGSFQFGVGAVVAPLTGVFGGVSALSLAAVMFGAVIVATVVFLVVAPALGRLDSRSASAETAATVPAAAPSTAVPPLAMATDRSR
jgi:DHA1 family bicyclomycin/chloramphenicol resistance-like MFS transporter